MQFHSQWEGNTIDFLDLHFSDDNFLTCSLQLPSAVILYLNIPLQQFKYVMCAENGFLVSFGKA